jgi:hypothetical protein
MKKIIKLTESDLTRIIKRVINEVESKELYYIIARPSHLEGKGMFVVTEFGYSMIPTSKEFRRRMETDDQPKSYETKGEALSDLKKVKRITKDRWDIEWNIEKF